MSTFLDANVVVSYFISSALEHRRAEAYIDDLVESGDSLAVSPQVLMESFKVMTHAKIFPDRVSAAKFRDIALNFLSDPAVVLVCPTQRAVEYALDAAMKKNIISSKIFDLLIYGTMREHGITKLATFNARDFTGLSEIETASIP